MQRLPAAVGSAVFFLAAPGIVAGVVPWLITQWRLDVSSPVDLVRVVVGLGVAVVATALLVAAFVRFVAEGRGTPAPVAPPERLVIGGAYRYVRNPMYVEVLTIILGQTLAFASLGLLVYAVVGWAVMASFVRFFEEPELLRQHGTDYERYRRSVRAWVPRLRPWTPERTPTT